MRVTKHVNWKERRFRSQSYIIELEIIGWHTYGAQYKYGNRLFWWTEKGDNWKWGSQ